VRFDGDGTAVIRSRKKEWTVEREREESIQVTTVSGGKRVGEVI